MSSVLKLNLSMFFLTLRFYTHLLRLDLLAKTFNQMIFSYILYLNDHKNDGG